VIEDLSLPLLEEVGVICFVVISSWVGWQWKEERDHRKELCTVGIWFIFRNRWLNFYQYMLDLQRENNVKLQIQMQHILDMFGE